MKGLIKPIGLAPLIIAGLSLGSINAYGAAIENYLSGGPVTFEDDSVEYIVRQDTCNDAGGCTDLRGNTYNQGDSYYRLLEGTTLANTDTIQQNDIIVQLYDIPIIRADGTGQNLPVDGVEVTGIALSKIDQVNSVGTVSTSGSTATINYDGQTTINEAASAADWQALTGIDITNINTDDGPMDFSTSGLTALIFFDNQDDFDVGTSPYPTALTEVTNGSLEIALAVSDVNDFITVENAPENLCTYAGCNGTPIPGVTGFGTYRYQLSVAYEGLGGRIDPNVVFGSGNSLASDNTVSGSIDDTQFTFNYVPEPGSALLMGLGLLGLSFFRKRALN